MPKTEKYAYNHLYRRCIDKLASHHLSDSRPTWLIVVKECTTESNKITNRKLELIGIGCPGKRSENPNDRNPSCLCHRGILSFTRCSEEGEESRTGLAEEPHNETEKLTVVGPTIANFHKEKGPALGEHNGENHDKTDSYCLHADDTTPALESGKLTKCEVDPTDARPDLGVTFHV